MFNAILEFYNVAKIIVPLIKMIINLLNEYEAKKAEDHRTGINTILDRLQRVQCDEEKHDIVRNRRGLI